MTIPKWSNGSGTWVEWRSPQGSAVPLTKHTDGISGRHCLLASCVHRPNVWVERRVPAESAFACKLHARAWHEGAGGFTWRSQCGAARHERPGEAAARQKTGNHQRQSKRTSTQLRQLQQHTEHRDGVYRSAFTSVRLGYNPKKPMNSPLPSLSLPSSKRGGEENHPLRELREACRVENASQRPTS